MFTPRSSIVAVIIIVTCGLRAVLAAQGPPKVWTQQDMLARNVGTREDQRSPFPPHRIVGNVYYVGTRSLSSFLVTTPQGHVLINTTFEANVPTIKASVESLGFAFADIKVILGSHAHGDHMEGDALAKELAAGARVMAMAEDVPALEGMQPGGKPHPIDRVLRDGDQVALGGTTLVAHLTPGHTRGCTTWTLKVQEAGRTYDIVIIGSVGVNPGMVLVDNQATPGIVEEFERSFKRLRGLPCDVPLGSHPAMYSMAEKVQRLGSGANPFIDPAGYRTELDIVEGVFRSVLAEQRRAGAR